MSPGCSCKVTLIFELISMHLVYVSKLSVSANMLIFFTNNVKKEKGRGRLSQQTSLGTGCSIRTGTHISPWTTSALIKTIQHTTLYSDIG